MENACLENTFNKASMKISEVIAIPIFNTQKLLLDIEAPSYLVLHSLGPIKSEAENRK